MLQLQWYIESPIDFEYKNYILLDYLSKLDNSYSVLKLSPYLLWTEKLVEDMNIFKINYNYFNKSIKREINFISGYEINYKKIDQPKEVIEIIDILDYSLPILESKIKMGYKLLDKYPQILY